LWGTATRIGGYGIHLADPGSGTAGYYGTIVETGVPGVLAVRLKVEKRRVTEIEAVIVRREQRSAGGGTVSMIVGPLPYQNNPADFAAVDPVYTTKLMKDERETASDLFSAVRSYYEALRASDGSRAALADDCERRANGVRVTGIVPSAQPRLRGAVERGLFR
jgi:hypothetical protein